MKSFLPLIAIVEASTFGVTWGGCGDASAHAKVTDPQPTAIQIGGTTTLTGVGVLDEGANGATFFADIAASCVKVAFCFGDASQDVVCNFPLGVGSATLNAQSFPLTVGQSPRRQFCLPCLLRHTKRSDLKFKLSMVHNGVMFAAFKVNQRVGTKWDKSCVTACPSCVFEIHS